MKGLTIYIDGGSRGNPGPAAVGVVVCNQKGEVLREYSEQLGSRTNNEAEYVAAIIALKKLKQWFGKKLATASDVTLNTDSEFLFKQMRGEYKVEEPRIQKLFLELWNLTVEYRNLRLRRISRKRNARADALVNEELDKEAGRKSLL